MNESTWCYVIAIVLGTSLTFNAIFAMFIVHEVRQYRRRLKKEIADWDKRNGYKSIDEITSAINQ